MNKHIIEIQTTLKNKIPVKKSVCKMCAVIVLGITPIMTFADYQGCRDAGGGFWSCAWEAAKNDRIMPPRDGNNGMTQFKKKYARDIGHCSKLPVERQKNCISKGIVKKTAKITKDISRVKSKSPTLKSRAINKGNIHKIK